MDFLREVVDTLDEEIAVIDRDAQIVFVNRAWRRFAEANGMAPGARWEGTNYLAACSAAVPDVGEACATLVAQIRGALAGARAEVMAEYPCHSPTAQRWFTMQLRPLAGESALFLVCHRDITARKLAELEAGRLAMEDALTGLANRRAFDRFLADTVRRCLRAQEPMSVILIDVDHFKAYNDRYGHPAGDRCLQVVARALRTAVQRPTDLVARFGGEEFAIVLGTTDADGALCVAEAARRAVAAATRTAALPAPVTVSAGVSTSRIADEACALRLISGADAALYLSKRRGRDRASSAPPLSS
jgi:diguanylate cyclase (GGDEF)-like protein